MTLEQAEQYTILKILAGSHVHGLALPTSDRDEEAIVVEPLDEAMGLGNPFEELVRNTPDVKYVSLRKWCRLACKGNPNFLLALFAPLDSILKSDARGSQLRSMAPMFISKQALKSHLGYMQGQRNRMVNHQREFGAGGGHGLPRFDLIAKFGYDTKFAMHLLRLGLQGIELGKMGKLTLPMPESERQALMSVRRGELSLEQVTSWANELEAEMKGIFDSCKLPEEPDYKSIESWMVDTYLQFWKAREPMWKVNGNGFDIISRA